MTKENIAEICHEANRLYCDSIGDHSQDTWDLAPKWQIESAVKGVEFHLAHPDSKPSDSHESWFAHKVADGWKYGPVKDPAKKEHPCMVPFDQLPKEQQVKDHLFLNIVRALEPALV